MVIEVDLFKVVFQTDPPVVQKHYSLVKNGDVAEGGYFASGEEIISSKCEIWKCVEGT